MIKGYFESTFEDKNKRLCHKRIYQYIGSYAPERPATLEEMLPLFEQVYHGCKALMYDDVFFDVYWKKIQQLTPQFPTHRFLTYRLSAWNTNLSLIEEFFPQKNLELDPYLSDLEIKVYLINEAALSMRMLGRPKEAQSLYRKAIVTCNLQNKSSLKNKFFTKNKLAHMSCIYHNLTDLQIVLGQINDAIASSQEATRLMRKSKRTVHNIWQEHNSIAYCAYALFLAGDIQAASVEFERANKLQRTIDPSVKYLYNTRGVFYADLLLAQGKIKEAIEVTTENFRICNITNRVDATNYCLRSFASIHRSLQEFEKAQEYALQVISGARKTGMLETEIQGLLELARIKSDTKKYEVAIQHASNVLKLTSFTGFKLYEPDAEVVLAKVYMALGEINKAKEFANSAYKKASEMHYHWPKVEAEELLKEISHRDI